MTIDEKIKAAAIKHAKLYTNCENIGDAKYDFKVGAEFGIQLTEEKFNEIFKVVELIHKAHDPECICSACEAIRKYWSEQ